MNTRYRHHMADDLGWKSLVEVQIGWGLHAASLASCPSVADPITETMPWPCHHAPSGKWQTLEVPYWIDPFAGR
jgi:hypothetical protein